MRKRTGRAARWLLAATMTASLAFGAAQAFAAPAPAEDGAARCSPSNCTISCQRRGFAGGDCVNSVCICWQT